MFANIVVGVIVGIILIAALRKTLQDAKNHTCSGCSGCGKKSICSKAR